LTQVESPPSTTDRTLLRAFRAWGEAEFERASGRFAPAWRERLRSAWNSSRKVTSEAAWADLRQDHASSARPDPSRIHHSWFVRALKSESPSVRLAVTANVPEAIGRVLRRELKIDSQDLPTDHPPDPEALGWALALWTERLVGDVAESDDDPPVVVAMTRLHPHELARLVKVCGLVKHAFASGELRPLECDDSIARFSPLDRVRLCYFRRHIAMADPRLGPLARIDLEVIQGDRRRAHSRLGLVTFGRLLASAEPHRARWATQHVPYQVARRMRVKDMEGVPRRALFAWESWVLEAAWARLFSEGRLSHGRGARDGNEEGDES